MPACELHLLALAPSCSTRQFLEILRQHSVKPLAQARVLRWVILPEQLSREPLLALNIHWDLLLFLEPNGHLPQEAEAQLTASWSSTCGIPNALVTSYADTNTQLLHPITRPAGPVSIPKPLASSAQKLVLSSELADYFDALPSELKRHPVSMLNLLAFHPGKKEQYQQYGKEFSKRVGSKHGGNVKLVGHVVGKQAKNEGWDEIAFVHYPSLANFASMIGDKAYQEVNSKYRLGALKDTFILCTMEIDDEGNLAGHQRRAGRL
ncbi:hypothetical protein GQ53DRAFT_754015 [Thozetella sp. PMI_491]|nr:hypothetical protein GQ53DRAFT_754015 [Thozetella sp. PMI_491]